MTTPGNTQSPKLYQERKGRQTQRLPGPRFAPDMSLVHDLPMATPYPSVEAIRAEGDEPPDAGRTEAWPRGSQERLIAGTNDTTTGREGSFGSYFFPTRYFTQGYFPRNPTSLPVLPVLVQSPKLYQERKGRQTQRLPTPRFVPDMSLVHDLPMAPPYPSVEAIRAEGDEPPDAGRTEKWPRGENELA